MTRLARLMPFCLLFLAAAGDGPPMAPAKDVTITYRTAHALVQGQPAKVIVRETATAAKIRIDNYIFVDTDVPYEGAIIDREAHRTTALLYSQQVAIDAPIQLYAIPGITLTPDLTFKRGADDKIMGYPCTNWDITQPAGGEVKEARQWTACITPDGVTLRSITKAIEWDAMSVVYAAIPAKVFEPTPDLKRLTALPPKK